MTTTIAAADVPQIALARLAQLGIAPEQPRAEVPPDEGIPALWGTIKAATQLIPMLVRPGKKGEEDFMILDGRRRFFGFQHGKSIGEADDDTPVKIIVVTDKNMQVAASMLAAMQTEPTHQADIIRAIGKLRAKKMTTAAIAATLGIDKLEIDRLGALSSLPDKAIQGLRDGRLTQRQCKLLTRVADAGTLDALIDQALTGSLTDSAIQSRAMDARIMDSDSRVRLVTVDGYRAAGGRVESDLFGEMPDILLDGDKLQAAWVECAKPVAAALKEQGLELFLSADRFYSAPEGFENIDPTARQRLTDAQRAAFAESEHAMIETRNTLFNAALGAENVQLVTDYALAQLASIRLATPDQAIAAVSLSPDHNFGIGFAFFAAPKAVQAEPSASGPSEETPAANDHAGDTSRPSPTAAPALAPSSPTTPSVAAAPPSAPPVKIEAKTNGQHELYTDLATRGLIRAVSEDPTAAFTLLVARMFSETVVAQYHDVSKTGSTIQATTYRRLGFEPIAHIDGEVHDRLAEYEAAFKASGKTVLAWVDDLSHGEKMTLLANVTAVSLDYRESGTRDVRKGARAEAAEIAELTAYDFTNYGTPPTAFFEAHDKAALLGLLQKMGAEAAEVSSLKKGDLAVHVAEQAAARNWAPDALSWRAEQPTDTAATVGEPVAPVGDGQDPADDETEVEPLAA